MTFAQVVTTSIPNNSAFEDYTHPDNHTIRAISKVCSSDAGLETFLSYILYMELFFYFGVKLI